MVCDINAISGHFAVIVYQSGQKGTVHRCVKMTHDGYGHFFPDFSRFAVYTAQLEKDKN